MVASPFPVSGFCMILPVFGITTVYILCVWMDLLLLQQVSPMDDAILVSFNCFCGFSEENGCF